MRTILVVEDEADILLTYRLAMEMAGYRVVGAASAEEGLTLLLRASPDAILLDLRLPGMDGMEFLRRLRDRQLLPGLPVIVTSAHADRSTRTRAVELGASAYLTKPFAIEELHSVLAEVLG